MKALVRALRSLTATTPGRYRVFSVGLAVLLVAVAVVGTIAAANMRARTDRIRDNAGPVLVATQSLVASLAEADGAQTAAYLSGTDEDREQRRSYEQAIDRAARSLEEISSLVGREAADAHDALKQISATLAMYSGEVERARAQHQAAVAGADEALLESVGTFTRLIDTDLTNLTTLTQERFEHDQDNRTTGVVIAAGIAVLALGALVLAQLDLTKRSRRALNLPLVLASLLILAALVWLTLAAGGSGDDVNEARRDGYDSIALTAQVQANGLRSRAADTVTLITGQRGGTTDADSAAIEVDKRLDSVSGQADSARERAAVAEMATRWERYTDVIKTQRSANGEAARAIAVGPATSTFNGFNASVESVLSDNRIQFTEALASASDRLRYLELAALVLPLLAAAAALFGYQLRINEYR